jgi:hypothetical protein
MSIYYNQNYTKEDISAVLQKIHECVRCGKYTISQNDNREENVKFIQEYNLNSEKQRIILMQIEVDDFCHSLKNTNLGFEHEVLYVFCPQIVLFSIDDEEKQIDLYTKFNILELPIGSRVVVISFHECNKPLDYLFN